MDSCPVCSLRYAWRCKCPRADSGCPAGHIWHTCPVHQRVLLGEARHGAGTLDCTCPEPPTHPLLGEPE